MIEVSEQAALTEIGRRLTLEFPQATPEDVDAAVKLAYSRFASSTIRDFVPLFVEKHARQDLSHPSLATNS
ncbi:three-helix bundle dimerization domain-containing protein [Mycolicibacterium sp.]|uniref:three-helix bundle dimerization domain-containing protein n=1 Tax=Mycolicibacterium sp. TaxID=2320850 RepID=UPI0037C8C0C5